MLKSEKLFINFTAFLNKVTTSLKVLNLQIASENVESIKIFGKNSWHQQGSVFFNRYSSNLCKVHTHVQGARGEKKKILFVKCRIHNLKENDSPPLNNKPTEMLEPAAVTTQKMPFKYMNVKNIGIFFTKQK